MKLNFFVSNLTKNTRKEDQIQTMISDDAHFDGLTQRRRTRSCPCDPEARTQLEPSHRQTSVHFRAQTESRMKAMAPVDLPSQNLTQNKKYRGTVASPHANRNTAAETRKPKMDENDKDVLCFKPQACARTAVGTMMLVR